MKTIYDEQPTPAFDLRLFAALVIFIALGFLAFLAGVSNYHCARINQHLVGEAEQVKLDLDSETCKLPVWRRL